MRLLLLVAGSRRDGAADVAAASVCRRVLETLPWDGPPVVVAATQLAEWFSFQDLEAACDRGELGEAGSGLVLKGWNMRRVGSSDGPVGWAAVEQELSSHKTVVFNSADAKCPRLAAASLAALDVFRLPVCVNVYATGPHTSVSAPPHTDKQRVLVLQTDGCKRWRVFAPTDPRKTPGADPLARGKGDDALLMSELGEPLLDTTLHPGDALFVPAGFPHATSTDQASLHLTLGLDTHVWGLDPAQARAGALQRAGLDDKLRPERDLDPVAYWDVARATLPLDGDLAAFLAQATASMEPHRWSSSDEARATLDLDAVAKRLATHRTELVAAQRNLYEDVVFRTQDGPLESRLGGHYRNLDSIQQSLLDWYKPATKTALLYKTGDKIRATMLGTDEYFDAVVDTAHLDGTLDVVFFDGELERNVSPDRVQRRKKNAAAAKSSSKSAGGFKSAAKKKKSSKKPRR